MAVVKGNLGEDKEIKVVYSKIAEETEAVEAEAQEAADEAIAE